MCTYEIAPIVILSFCFTTFRYFSSVIKQLTIIFTITNYLATYVFRLNWKVVFYAARTFFVSVMLIYQHSIFLSNSRKKMSSLKIWSGNMMTVILYLKPSDITVYIVSISEDYSISIHFINMSFGFVYL